MQYSLTIYEQIIKESGNDGTSTTRRLPLSSPLYNALVKWYGTLGALLDSTAPSKISRGVFVFTTSGTGDWIDSDLLGGNGDGSTRRRFERGLHGEYRTRDEHGYPTWAGIAEFITGLPKSVMEDRATIELPLGDGFASLTSVHSPVDPGMDRAFISTSSDSRR